MYVIPHISNRILDIFGELPSGGAGDEVPRMVTGCLTSCEAKCCSMLGHIWALSEEVDHGERCCTVRFGKFSDFNI